MIEDIITGIQAGAYYYITKPYDQTTLIAITRAAISEFTKLDLLRMELMDQEALREKLYLLKTASFDFKNMVDVRFLSIFLSNMYPNPQLAVLGISELLLNAIEHGNLNITYEEKSRLLEDRMWEQEIKRRLIKSEYTNKTAHAHIKKESDRIILEITDAGKGFDWTEFLDISKDRATHLHGRGIALSKSISFDELEYVGPGNKVITKVFHSNEAL